MEITFLKRPLLEVQISFDDDEKTNDLISWLEEYATFDHKEGDEFILWIPPTGTSQDHYIKGTYGDEIPEIIGQILKEAMKLQQGMADQGYLLIVFG